MYILIPKEYHDELRKVSPNQLKNTIEQFSVSNSSESSDFQGSSFHN